MGPLNPKLGIEIFTTGMVARMCGVAARTVTRWCDSGDLVHYKIPMTQDRRINRSDLISLLQNWKVKLPKELGCGVKLACMFTSTDVETHLPDWVAVDVFGAGRECERAFVSDAVIADDDGIGVAVQLASSILSLYPLCHVTLLVSESAPATIVGWTGRVIRRPDGLARFAAEVSDAKETQREVDQGD